MTHRESIESAASYALDALDPAERAEFEAHLAGCTECQSEVLSYREVVGQLAQTVPASAIPRPEALRGRILREARQVRPIAAAASRRTTSNGTPMSVALASAGPANAFAPASPATTLAVAAEINDGGFIDDCAMTVEPTGGSPRPTEPPQLIGTWRHVD